MNLFFVSDLAHASGTANFYIPPVKSPITTNQNLTVPVKIYPNGTSIDTARVVLEYNSKVLKATKFQLASGLNVQAPSSYIDNDKGLISWGAFDMEYRVNTPVTFGIVTFSPITTGQSQIKLASASRLLSSGEDVSNPSQYNQLQVTVAAANQPTTAKKAASDLPPEYNYKLPVSQGKCWFGAGNLLCQIFQWLSKWFSIILLFIVILLIVKFRHHKPKS